jgi:hypothetical protein
LLIPHPAAHPSLIQPTFPSIIPGNASAGASSIYLSKHAPINHRNTSAPSICVGFTDGTIACSSASAQLKLKKLPPSACQGHIMPSFPRTLVSIAPLCDANLTVTFTKHDVKAYDQAGTTILECWPDPRGASDWHFPLIDANHNSNDNSLFSSNNNTIIIPATNPPSVLSPPPATMVHNTYWDQIKNEKRPAGTKHMIYHERHDKSLVTT